MNQSADVMDRVGELLDLVDLDAVLPSELLPLAARANALASRLTAIAGLLAARAERIQATMRTSGTPTTTWLATHGLTRREAAGLLHRGRELSDHGEVGRAAAQGRVSMPQARAIGSVLDSLDGLGESQQVQAEQVMLGLAATLDADGLGKAAATVLAVVDPQRAEESSERRLQRQYEAARRNRSLTFGKDGNGSVTFAGSLPRVEGEQWLTILDAWTESQRRCLIEERDPSAISPSPAQRRADALIGMIQAHIGERRAPAVGGDRPRVVVTMSYDSLRVAAAGAGLMGDEPLSAGELRRLCCDADLIPAVLGAASEVLDVGRSQRLVTAPIRGALTLRDGGCAFPGCQTRPNSCEAHHIEPWWAGGDTALSNLVLLCHHHHGLVEPARYGSRDQWEVRLAADGRPEFVPPGRFDPARRPLRHQRGVSRPPPTAQTARAG